MLLDLIPGGDNFSSILDMLAQFLLFRKNLLTLGAREGPFLMTQSMLSKFCCRHATFFKSTIFANSNSRFYWGSHPCYQDTIVSE